jgi:hypothetical protein
MHEVSLYLVLTQTRTILFSVSKHGVATGEENKTEVEDTKKVKRRKGIKKMQCKRK